jgi:serine/threonine protein kinase
MNQAFDWANRIGVAASISEALAFMHQELKDDGIAHGNLKSCNILMNKNMEPCISEYGLMSLDSKYGSSLTRSKSSRSRVFQGDIYGLGVILLELLTGKMARNSGVDLADWVVSVVREEWTAEFFDKVLISEGASEERLLNLLQVAIKCLNNSPDARPSINQVATMINTLKDEDDRSMSFEPSLQ